ncbi:MAG: hypothetical protein HY098_08085 [Nitrospinae bacterium]|nr:hypothetical protein [Nitrospinota bacterium]
MAESEEKDERGATWRKVESLLFPLFATIVGIGYAAAILINNEPSKVLRSPHALLILVIFAGITFFSIRTLVRDARGAVGKSGK